MKNLSVQYIQFKDTKYKKIRTVDVELQNCIYKEKFKNGDNLFLLQVETVYDKKADQFVLNFFLICQIMSKLSRTVIYLNNPAILEYHIIISIFFIRCMNYISLYRAKSYVCCNSIQRSRLIQIPLLLKKQEN